MTTRIDSENSFLENAAAVIAHLRDFGDPTTIRLEDDVWALSLHRADLRFQTAFNEACEKARTETGLPFFHGRPEA